MVNLKCQQISVLNRLISFSNVLFLTTLQIIQLSNSAQITHRIKFALMLRA